MSTKTDDRLYMLVCGAMAMMWADVPNEFDPARMWIGFMVKTLFCTGALAFICAPIFYALNGRWPFEPGDEPDEPQDERVTVERAEPPPPRPKVRTHIFDGQKKGPNVVTVGGPKTPPPPAAPAPKAEAPAATVTPSTTAYVKARTGQLMDEWGWRQDEAARTAQEEFENLKKRKDKEQAKSREGIGPKGAG